MPIDTNAQRQWTKAVATVIEQAQGWASKRNWRAKVQSVQLTEDKLGTYEVPLLTVEAKDGRLILEPVARWSSPGEGRIDVYSWPSLNRLMLIRKNGSWVLLTEAGVPWPQAWNETTFGELAAALNASR